MEQVEGNNIIIIIFFISSTSEEHTVFDKYISDTKTHNASNDVLPNRKILLYNMNEFHFQNKDIDTFDSL